MTHGLLRHAIALAAKARANGASPFGRVVFALSTGQPGTVKPAATGAGLAKESPALFDEAQVPADSY